MILFKQYSNIKNFLNRYTIIKIGTLHIRIHKIMDKDRTNFYHNHPFNYVSIILKGGYNDKTIDTKTGEIKYHRYNIFSIIKRKYSIYHRIEEVKGDTVTLFIAYGKYNWNVLNSNVNTDFDGLFERIINGNKIWCKNENGIWFIGNKDKEIALKEIRYSIHQV